MSTLVRMRSLARNGDTVWVLDELRDRLEVAERHLGAPIQVRSADSGWRAYAEQARYYNGWVKRLPGFNPASNPDTGERGHMRGASLDIFREDAAAQAAMRAAGFIRDPKEPWHWNLPGLYKFPVIKTLPRDVPTLKEEDMTFTDADRLALFQVKQLLTETQSWMGIGQMLGEVYKLARENNQLIGIVRQLITETTSWKGLGFLAADTYQRTIKVEEMLNTLLKRGDITLGAEERAAIAAAVAEAAGSVEPIDWGRLEVIVERANDDEHRELIGRLDQVDAQQKVTLAAIAQVDEATLAQFGLQRIPPTS